MITGPTLDPNGIPIGTTGGYLPRQGGQWDNPADKIVASMQVNAKVTSVFPPLKRDTREQEILDRLARLENEAVTTINHPYQMSDASTGGTAKVSVRYGTVNDDITDNVATALTLTNSTTNYVCLNCTLNVAGTITDSDLEVNTTGLPANDDDSAYILIGTVVTGSGTVTTINQAVTHSLRFDACGRTDDGGDPAAVTARGDYQFWGV